ncbi:hypothetical protein KC222_20770 [Cedecea davisae]|uniref:Uncharacterized protein n=1 Tax=Cedecea davisae TaxID=158484 RepID=A0ABS6DMH9_9ENTR|nr:hypothetical protein [Cedecea davisae]MBU4684431.1 hypothetical protein [Cedecea davisae]MBU4688723.1 hypothetical protein [Cedecea davisae]
MAEKLAVQRKSRAIIPLRAGVCIAIFVKLFQKSRIYGQEIMAAEHNSLRGGVNGWRAAVVSGEL